LSRERREELGQFKVASALFPLVPDAQVQLESISKALRIPGSKSLGPVAKAIRKSQDILKKERKKIEADFVPAKKVKSEECWFSTNVSKSMYSAI
jgi:hypothetical protein